jgi:hypothetical protein
MFEMEYFQSDHIPYPSGDYLLVSERLTYYDLKKQDGKIYITHSVSKDKVPEVNQILFKYYPDCTIGIHDPRDAIVIYLQKSDKHVIPNMKVTVSVDFEFANKKLYDYAEQFVIQIANNMKSANTVWLYLIGNLMSIFIYI